MEVLVPSGRNSLFARLARERSLASYQGDGNRVMSAAMLGDFVNIFVVVRAELHFSTYARRGLGSFIITRQDAGPLNNGIIGPRKKC